MNGSANGDERNSLVVQKINQGLAFGAVRVNGYVHCVAVIEAELIVSLCLPERADGNWLAEFQPIESIHFAEIAQIPVVYSGETNQ